MPFEVPENWEWIKLGECGDVITGMTPSKDNKLYYGGKIPFYKPTDLEQGEYTLYSSDTLSTLGFSQCRQLPCNSILVTCIGATIGKTGIIKSRGACNQQINAIVPYCFLNYQYLYYVCVSNYMQTEIRDNSSSTTLPILNKSKFSELMIPLPPLNEQFRIIRAVKDILLEIENLDRERHNLRNQIHNIKNLVIELAISGKLVPHKPLDEPATELLRRINPNYTPCDNRHYENVQYPDSWKVVKMGEMVRIISGVAYSKSDVTISGIKVIRGGNIQAGEIIECDDDVYIDNRYADPTNNIYKGDIVLVASTGSQQLIGKTGFATRDYVHTQIGAFLRILRPKDIRCADFLNLFFQSDYYRQYIRSLAKGTNINNVKNSYIEDFVIGLPPLQEQNRIVAFTNKIFYMIDEILAGL